MPLPDRLAYLYDGIKGIIDKFKPDVVSCEDPFFCKDVRAAINIGRAWAAAAIASRKRQIPFTTYSPLEIKKATVGYGRATKGQVNEQMKRLLKIDGDVPEDASDALACAFCFISDMRNYIDVDR